MNGLFLPPFYADFETFTDKGYTLSSLSTVEYVKDARFFVQCMSYACPVSGEHGVVWHDDPSKSGDPIADKLNALDLSGRTLVCHNTAFDGFILAEHYRIWFDQYACTQSMAQTLLRHRSAGFSLDAVHEHLTGDRGKTGDINPKDLRGNREIEDPTLRKLFAQYAVQDVVALMRVFQEMAPMLPAGEWWHMDWCMLQMIDPQFVMDKQELDDFAEHTAKVIEAEFTNVGIPRTAFRSNPQFAALLVKEFQMLDPLQLQVPHDSGKRLSVARIRNQMLRRYAESSGDVAMQSLPIKANPKGEYTYAFARTDVLFKERVLESSNPRLREFGRLRLLATSSQEESQARQLERHHGLLEDNLIPMGVKHSGTHTHRLTASGSDSGINVLAMKRGSPIRRVFRAREGTKVFSLDMAAFELRICRWLVQDKPSMQELVKHDADLYSVFAAEVFQVAREEVSAKQRQVGKTSELQLQYQSGARTLLNKLVVSGITTVGIEEAGRIVSKFRKVAHPQLSGYWRYCHNTVLPRMTRDTDEYELKNAPFITYTKDYVRLPDGNKMWYPLLSSAGGNYRYMTYKGRAHLPEEIYGGNLMQHCCQALAACIIKEKKRLVSDETGWRCAHEVYDDLTFIVPESVSHDDCEAACRLVVRPVSWWPELPLACEWGVGDSWGAVEKTNKAFGWQP